MIKIEKVNEVPPALYSCWNKISIETLKTSKSRLRSLIATSSDVRYVTDDDLPLFIIGAYKRSLLETRCELWMYATTNLRASHMKELFKLIWNWINGQPDQVFARANCDTSRRMLKFLGFTLIQQTDDISIYEAL